MDNRIDTKKLRDIFIKDEFEKIASTKLNEKMTPSEIRFELEFPLSNKIDKKIIEDKYYRSSCERVTCQYCSGIYARGCITYHKKTKRHKLYEYLNNKLIELLKSY